MIRSFTVWRGVFFPRNSAQSGIDEPSGFLSNISVSQETMGDFKEVGRVGVVLSSSRTRHAEAIEPFLYKPFLCDPILLIFPSPASDVKHWPKANLPLTRAKKVQHHYDVIGEARQFANSPSSRHERWRWHYSSRARCFAALWQCVTGIPLPLRRLNNFVTHATKSCCFLSTPITRRPLRQQPERMQRTFAVRFRSVM